MISRVEIAFQFLFAITIQVWQYCKSYSDTYYVLICGVSDTLLYASFCRPGSVVFDFRVVMKTSAYRVNESQALVTPSVVRRVLVTAVQNAKNSGRQLLLSGVDVNNISVVVGKLENCKFVFTFFFTQMLFEEWQSVIFSATLTTQPTPSTMPSTAVSNMKTTASTQQPTVAMTTIPNNTTGKKLFIYF